jgi:hypothetical protein
MTRQGGPSVADDDLQTVRVLFDQAQITMSDEELERFGRTYRSLRAQADALYRSELFDEAPALAFDPLNAYS